MIEIDGILHFKNIEKWNQLENVRKKDTELNEAASKMGYVLIRVGYDQWNHRGEFKQECLDRIHELLQNPVSGVYKIGEVYSVEH